MFIELMFQNPEEFFTWIVLVVFSICCHEFMHAFTADRLGDETPRLSGHLTFNPLKQMGVASLFMLAFIGIAWGAVPVNPAQLRSPRARALVSLSGPLTNLALFLIFLTACLVAMKFSANGHIRDVLFLGAFLNLSLALFNLLPIPPLDGFGIIRPFFPELGFIRTEWLNGLMLMLFLAAFYFAHWLFRFAGWVTGEALVLGIRLLNLPPEALWR